MANAFARGIKSLSLHMEAAGASNEKVLESMNKVAPMRLKFSIGKPEVWYLWRAVPLRGRQRLSHL